MDKSEIINNLKRLGEGLSIYTVEKIKDDDKVFAIEDIRETICDLSNLMNEIIHM